MITVALIIGYILIVGSIAFLHSMGPSFHIHFLQATQWSLWIMAASLLVFLPSLPSQRTVPLCYLRDNHGHKVVSLTPHWQRGYTLVCHEVASKNHR